MSESRAKTPRHGSTDWAAQQFLRMLDQEEKRKVELKRLRAEGWQPAVSRMPADERHGPTFGDGSDAVANLVQQEIDRQQLMQGEARRRARAQPARIAPQSPLSSEIQAAQLQTSASGGQAPVLIIPRQPLPMPEKLGRDYRKGWHIFAETLRDPAIMPPLTESEAAAFRTTFGLEGGMEYDPGAGGRGVPGRAGVTENFLSDALGRLGSAIEPDAKKLMVQEVAQIYKMYVDDALRNVGGGSALAKIGDEKTAMQIFDVLYQHGRGGGARVLQDAVNSVIDGLPDGERSRLGLSRIVIKDPTSPRAFGPQTLERISRLVESGYAKRLRGAIADERSAAYPNPGRLGGLNYRYNYHR